MLEKLIVRNYVLIDHLDLDFQPGFSVFTGETGSGKSIMLGALSLLLGAKADKEAVRKGEDAAEISGVFTPSSQEAKEWLSAHDIAMEDDEVIIRRTIRSSGRSSYSINGSPVTRQEGEEFGQLLVDISSQHAHQSLMRTDVLRDLVDKATGREDLFSQYRDAYREMKAKEKERERLMQMLASSAEENDYMEFCLRELDDAALVPGEDDEIQSRLAVVNSSEFLKESLSSVSDELRDSSSALSQALSAMRKAERRDPGLSELSERLESLSIECDDIQMSIRDRLSAVDFSEEDLERLNARLAVLQRIKRRFGPTLEAAIAKREEYREKLGLSSGGEDIASDLEREIAMLGERAGELAGMISRERMAAGREMVRQRESSLGRVVWRPVDRRENYVKRCVALPGDTLEIRDNAIYINGRLQENAPGVQHNYFVQTDGAQFSADALDRLNVNVLETMYMSSDASMSPYYNMIGLKPLADGSYGQIYLMALTQEALAKVKAMPAVKGVAIEKVLPEMGYTVYPLAYSGKWGRDNFGPLWIPAKGATIPLTEDNIIRYERCIVNYEHNTLDYRDGRAYLNGEPADTYTFKMDYYWMMGDNRHNSADSRSWGFVPEDHIVGRPVFVWLSLDKAKGWLDGKIRWNRFGKDASQ